MAISGAQLTVFYEALIALHDDGKLTRPTLDASPPPPPMPPSKLGPTGGLIGSYMKCMWLRMLLQMVTHKGTPIVALEAWRLCTPSPPTPSTNPSSIKQGEDDDDPGADFGGAHGDHEDYGDQEEDVPPPKKKRKKDDEGHPKNPPKGRKTPRFDSHAFLPPFQHECAIVFFNAEPQTLSCMSC